MSDCRENVKIEMTARKRPHDFRLNSPRTQSMNLFSFYFRNAYTSRILEIISNIKKQKTDIDKVLKDTRELQKEINNINGQLDRQFTVTDDLLFKVTAPTINHSTTIASYHSHCLLDGQTR